MSQRRSISLPNVFANCQPGTPELIGPIASVIKASDDADAMRIANDSRYGLSGIPFIHLKSIKWVIDVTNRMKAPLMPRRSLALSSMR